MNSARTIIFTVILVVCVLIAESESTEQEQSNHRERAALRSRSVTSILEDPPAARRDLGGDKPSPHSDGGEKERHLTYDFYASSCPSAEQIVRTTVRELHSLNGSVGPALLRLAFHDCFVHGCDASVLLDSDIGIESEKGEIPNLSLKGFEEIDTIKSRVENECPAIVSCADIVALAARESVLLAGGQFYPVLTGRLDSKDAFPPGQVRNDLPGPDFVISQSVEFFAKKGFNPREMVALLGGGHSTGKIHCDFIRRRIFNFTGNNQPDPSINAEFLEVLRSQCSHPSSSPSQSPSPSPPSSFENRAMKMDYEGAGNGFGEVYYRSLMQWKGLLISDQQLMEREDTKSWVEEYASNLLQFRRDFRLAMFKLTHIQNPKRGGHEVRLNCRKMN